MSEALQRLASFDPFAAGGAPSGVEAHLRYLVLDVFTDQPLTGNPLAVFPDARAIPETTMQALARELKLSETVFLLPADCGGDVRARIFTPVGELPFAGHPVLGSAVLAALALERARLTLETRAGPIAVEVRHDGARIGFGRMSQPIPTWRAYEHEPQLLGALGVQRSRLPVEAYRNGPEHVFVALASERELARLRPDLRTLGELEGVLVSCFAGARLRWSSRMFAPALGVPEDPATGSAAGPLAVHLARHGQIAFGQEVEIRQGLEIDRPSLLLACAEGSAQRVEAVHVAGSAVLVAGGAFAL